jgi:hypothetical protein
VKIDSAVQNIAHLFLDTAPVIYRLHPLSWLGSQGFLTNDATLRRVTESTS